MARAAGPWGGADPGRQPELTRVVHDLGNKLHALTLRLLVLENTTRDPEVQAHVHAAQRLAKESTDLLIEARAPQVVPPRRLTRHRNPR
jgi:hypothetical protein